jgi:cyclopropane fatty-acyl-phospholipid synthase-like methyltransferase
MQPVAAALARLLPLDSDRDTRVLDVSASHGVYGIAFAHQNPRARVVGLDWAAILDVSVANAQQAGVGDRYERLPGSAFEADLGTGYDLILIPNFLHHFNPSDCVRFLRKTHAALAPGGRVAIVEFVPNEDRVTPPPAAGFSLVMLATTPEGDAYTFADYQQMLTQSGFSQVAAHPLKPSASTAVIASR